LPGERWRCPGVSCIGLNNREAIQTMYRRYHCMKAKVEELGHYCLVLKIVIHITTGDVGKIDARSQRFSRMKSPRTRKSSP
jgi:hypothetical protein